MTGADLVTALRETAAEQSPAQLRGLWLSFLSPYGLEAVVGLRTGQPQPAPAATESGAANAEAAEPTPPLQADAAAANRIDWVAIDLQHGDLTTVDVTGLLRVAERAGLPVLVRMPSHDPAAIGRMVDAGVDGVIVPAVESAEQAEALVRAIRLPPAGARSTGVARAALGVVPRAEGTAVAEPLLLPMVETRAGLDHATEIAAVAGVDGVFVGPYDLSLSLGTTPGSPDVLGVITSLTRDVRAAGKVVGIYAGRDDLLSLAATVDMVAVDSDVGLLRRGVTSTFGG